MIEDVRRRARAYFEEASPAHDWYHVQRVEGLANTITGDRSESVDERVLSLSVLLHDIGRAREERGEIDDHAEWAAREAGEILAELGVDPAPIEDVRHCVRAHRYSNDVEPTTPAARVLSDADNLDALGAVGVARAFAYGGALGQPLHDLSISIEADDSTVGRTQVNHLRKKILDLPERMYTGPGRRLAEQRRSFVEQFLQRFEREARGDA